MYPVGTWSIGSEYPPSDQIFRSNRKETFDRKKQGEHIYCLASNKRQCALLPQPSSNGGLLTYAVSIRVIWSEVETRTIITHGICTKPQRLSRTEIIAPGFQRLLHLRPTRDIDQIYPTNQDCSSQLVQCI